MTDKRRYRVHYTYAYTAEGEATIEVDAATAEHAAALVRNEEVDTVGDEVVDIGDVEDLGSPALVLDERDLVRLVDVTKLDDDDQES